MTLDDGAWASGPGLRLRMQLLIHGATGMSDSALDDLSLRATEELELRVGNGVISVLTERQIENFELLTTTGSEATVEEFFRTNLPTCGTVVRNEEKKIILEVIEACLKPG